MRVGAYDFLHPLDASPAEAADFLLSRLPATLVPGRDLRPALDAEQGTPSRKVGAWVSEVAAIVRKHTGPRPLIYGSGWYLEACQFKTAPGPLWLAAYGRNDGREYPVGRAPAPWRTVAAHQFTSRAHVAGIHGECDLSHVLSAASLEIPKGRG